MLLNIILWIVFGALAGWLASKIMGTDPQQGALANIVVGVLGALIGGFVVGVFGVSVETFSIPGLLVAILGAVILLWLVKALR